MKAKLLTLSISVFLASICVAQTNKKDKGIRVAYFNDQLVRPGFSIGFEKSILKKIKTKGNGKIIARDIISKNNAGFFTQYRHSTSVFFNTTIGFRFTNNSGFIVESFRIGLGYMQTFLNGNTFIVDNNGNVSNKKMASNRNLMLPYISVIGLGYDFRKSMQKPFSISMSTDFYFQRPVNTESRTHLALPISIIYYLN